MTLENDGKKWSWEETVLAFNLYSKTQLSKITPKNPEVLALAELLGRKPGSVAKKMLNIGSQDPEQIKRGVKLLSHINKYDREIWERFGSDSESVVNLAVDYLAELKSTSIEEVVSEDVKNLEGFCEDIELEIFPYGEDRECATHARVGQYYFRMSVLSSYDYKCCVTGLTEPQLLVASHIKPWSQSNPKTERTNPKNGLCLNSLHDRAFDRGFITINDKYEIVVSNKLKETQMDEETRNWLMSYDHRQIVLPNKFLPAKEYIQYHNDVIFQG